MPVFSSGQTAAQAEATYKATRTSDLIYCAGGGIMGHPGGVADGVARILRQAWDAALAGIGLADYARDPPPPLAAALAAFGAEGQVSEAPLIAYYGDDFTGSTDVLEALPPQPRHRDRAVHRACRMRPGAVRALRIIARHRPCRDQSQPIAGMDGPGVAAGLRLAALAPAAGVRPLQGLLHLRQPAPHRKAPSAGQSILALKPSNKRPRC